jgi:DNA-binding transcriptional MerR regulator
MSLMTIGVFAARCRLSPKALRLYDDLGLLAPAATDPVNGYRLYRPDQVERARMVGLLRRLDMPLATIALVLDAPPEAAGPLLREYWEQVEATNTERRALVRYLQARLTGAEMTQYEVQTRRIPERRVLSINRHLHAAETDAFFDEAFARLRSAGPGLAGIDGAPYLVFYGEVSDDSDGPMELCRPVSENAARGLEELGADIESRVEPSHDEAFVRLSMAELGWPEMLPVVDALEAWAGRERRQPAGALRQVLIADQRTADPQTLVCDLTIPLTIPLT